MKNKKIEVGNFFGKKKSINSTGFLSVLRSQA